MTDVLSPRQHAILALVDQQGFVATDQLVTHFGVTPQTIRRDINILCTRHELQRFHGGAGRSTSSANEPYDDRKRRHSPAKQRIAENVARHIRNGSSLFLNIGTTTEAVASALKHHRDLTIVTNNINVAMTLSENDSFQIMVAGGRLRPRDGGITGPVTTDFMRQFQLDYGVIGVSGIDESGSLLDFDYEETLVTSAIIDNARETILVADHTKFGRRAMTRVGHLDQIDRLFTDCVPGREFGAILAQCNVAIAISD